MNESELLRKLEKIKITISDQSKEIENLKSIIAQKDDELNLIKRQRATVTTTSKPKENPALLSQNLISEEAVPINYVFARATKHTAEKFEKFIRKCIPNEENKPFLVMPETAAIYVDISAKTKDMFMGILMGMSLENKKLITKTSDDKYIANFSADKICSYLLREI